MYVASWSQAGAGGYWNILFPVSTPSAPYEEKTWNLAFYEREPAKYHNARHVKVVGNFWQLNEEEWRRISRNDPSFRFVSGGWTGPVDSKGYHVVWNRGGTIPSVPSQYASRVTNSAATPYSYSRYRYGKLEYTHSACIWVNDTGQPRLFAVCYDPTAAVPTWRFRTTVASLYALSATAVEVGTGLCSIVHNSKVPRKVMTSIGNLTVPAIEQMHATNVNQFEFAQDLNLVRQVVDLGRSIATLDASSTLKDLASIYLSYSFGAASTYRDYVELGESIAKETSRYSSASRYRDRKVHARSSGTVDFLNHQWSARYNLTAYLDNYDQGIMGLMNSLDRWGFYPDREAVWELVPFSFIVDWFSNVQENLARRDAQSWREYYNCHACITSYKLETDWSYQDQNASSTLGGSAHISLYNRSVQPGLPQPEVDLDVHLPKGLHQWVTGAALVIQRSGR
jgi:hypothetical protein